MTIDLNPDLGERVRKAATDRGLSIQDYVSEAIERQLSYDESSLHKKKSAPSIPQKPVLSEQALAGEGIYGDD